MGPAGMSAFCVTLFPCCSVPASGEELESGCYDSADNISGEVRCKDSPCSRSQAHDPGSPLHTEPASRRLHNCSISTFPSGGDRKVPSDKLAAGGCGGRPYPAARRRSAGLAIPSLLGVFLLTGSRTMIQAVAIATAWKEAFLST